MEQLIHRAKMRDADAFSELIQLQMQSMYKTAAAILLNDADAADAVQETILICWEKIGQLRNEQYFKTWLIRILINECYNILRKNRKIVYIPEYTEQAADVGTYIEARTEDNLEKNLEWKEAMASIDEKYRIVLLLFYAEGFSGKEIAKILKISHATVRTRLARGREQLKKYFTDR